MSKNNQSTSKIDAVAASFFRIEFELNTKNEL